MNDVKLHATLQKVLAREGQSLLQFVGESFPWTAFDEQALLAQVQKMIDDERRAAVALSNYMRRQRIPLPQHVPYPLHYTSWLFVSLDYLLPQLVEHQRKAVDDLKRDVETVQQPDARQPLENLLHVKQWHLTKLQEMAAQRSKAKHAAAAAS
jgi:hypothetical protein